MDRGADMVNATVSALGSIDTNIQGLAAMILEVGAAADEQARTSAEVAEQVDENLARVASNATATGQMARTVAEVAHTAAELARVAEAATLRLRGKTLLGRVLAVTIPLFRRLFGYPPTGLLP